MDFANQGEATVKLLDALDEIAVVAGGAVNPCQDFRMSPAIFEASFPAWKRLEALRDPAMVSDFWRRTAWRPGKPNASAPYVHVELHDVGVNGRPDGHAVGRAADAAADREGNRAPVPIGEPHVEALLAALAAGGETPSIVAASGPVWLTPVERKVTVLWLAASNTALERRKSSIRRSVDLTLSGKA